MDYIPQKWLDHIVQYPNRYIETQQGQYTTETPAPGEILQQGTPQSATNFNRLEQGVFEAHIVAGWLMTQMLRLQRDTSNASPYKFTVTLSNALEYPHNNSGASLAFPTEQTRRTKDYFVGAEVVNATGGSGDPGDVVIYNKLLNGFGVRFTGGAASVTLNLYVTGGTM